MSHHNDSVFSQTTGKDDRYAFQYKRVPCCQRRFDIALTDLVSPQMDPKRRFFIKERQN